MAKRKRDEPHRGEEPRTTPQTTTRLSLVDRVAEQDAAAGGREKRMVRLPGGKTARASIELKEFTRTPGRTWAYLRYSVGGKTVTVYVGNVTAPSRAEALKLAWQLARSKGLLHAS